MVSHLDPSVPSYPSWELTSNNYKRAVMNRVDGLRNDNEADNRNIQKRINEVRQLVAEELKDISLQVRESYVNVAHLTGQIRHELKHLPVIPIPSHWGLPVYQFGQRVLMTEYNLIGTVTGIEYSDGTIHDAGWHYRVKLDYNPVPRDEIENATEYDLKPLGLSGNKYTDLTIFNKG